MLKISLEGDCRGSKNVHLHFYSHLADQFWRLCAGLIFSDVVFRNADARTKTFSKQQLWCPTYNMGDYKPEVSVMGKLGMQMLRWLAEQQLLSNGGG